MAILVTMTIGRILQMAHMLLNNGCTEVRKRSVKLIDQIIIGRIMSLPEEQIYMKLT
jgi:hypothetical protein